MHAEAAVSSIMGAGPTTPGTINTRFAASIAPVKADASQGWATAVGTGAKLAHRASSRSYFPVPVACFISRISLADELTAFYPPLCIESYYDEFVVTPFARAPRTAGPVSFNKSVSKIAIATP